MNSFEVKERLSQLESALHQHERVLIEQVLPLPLTNPQKHDRIAELKAADIWSAKTYVGPTGALTLSFEDLDSIRYNVRQSVANGYPLSIPQKVALALAGLMTPV